MKRHPESRGTIALVDARVLDHTALAGDQFVLRLHAPPVAERALPGSFVHLSCDPSLPMRRPMSIMRAQAQEGWIDILYKAHGLGTRLLAHRTTGESLSLLGPIGRSFKLDGYRRRPLLIGGGVGIPPMIFLAEHLRGSRDIQPLVLMGSEVPFPFSARPSQHIIPGMPEGTIAAMPLLEDWGTPSRLASLAGYAGVFEGLVTDLARTWLQQFDRAGLNEVEIFSCGPTPMLRAVAALAAEYDLPCQVSLEEYMACAVGGCAGCTVQVRTPEGPAMKRVCVDGPVFEAESVFP